MKPNLIFANPTSGKGRGAKVLSRTLSYLDSQKLRYNVIAASSLSASLADLNRRNLNEFERCLVIGGDGMMHHAINAVSDFLPIGLIPAGTGNDFARALGLELRYPERNIDLFLSRQYEAIDLGEVNGRRFAAICSTGFDSIVNERANTMSWPRGKRKYDIAMLQELPRFKPRRYQITVDEKSFEAEAMLIAVGNGSSYGGGMKVCPNADLRDGMLDVMLLHPVPKLEFLKIFPHVYSGGHIKHPQVEILRGRSITIKGDAVTYADGERIAPTPASITALPGVLRTWMLDVQ